jgi:hypothetical protein
MSENDRQSALLSALTTEHFVLQTAANGTISEASARASLYIFSLSSSLIAMGFVSQSRDVFVPFVAAVLPALFLLGIFTVVRLVDTTLENMHFLTGIARIRGYYRKLAPEAGPYFAPETGRWPEAASTPALWHGKLVGFLGTSATMVALVNSIVAGAGVTLFTSNLLGGKRTTLVLLLGTAAAIVLMAAFLVYQRWRFRSFALSPSHEAAADVEDRRTNLRGPEELPDPPGSPRRERAAPGERGG